MGYLIFIFGVVVGYIVVRRYFDNKKPAPQPQVPVTHLVVAGNYRQYQYWADGHFSPSERQRVKYVRDTRDMKGYRNVKVHFIGTYFERKDLADIQREVLSLTPFLAK